MQDIYGCNLNRDRPFGAYHSYFHGEFEESVVVTFISKFRDQIYLNSRRERDVGVIERHENIVYEIVSKHQDDLIGEREKGRRVYLSKSERNAMDHAT